MCGARAFNSSGPHNNISPVTMSDDWPKTARLLFVVFCAAFGSTMNGFFIASFFVEHTLKGIGYVFLACVGIADMIMTSCIMPVAAVILLSGQWDNIVVCRALHFFGITSTYCYSLYFLMVSANSFYKYCRPKGEYEVFLTMRIGLISILIFITSVLTAAAGVFLGEDYDYCERKHYGNFYFRITTAVLFYAIPALLTIVCLFKTVAGIRRRSREQGHKRLQKLKRDSSMNTVNIFAYLLYMVGWSPYLIVIYEFPSTTDDKFYSVVWIGLFRSIVTSFIYGTANRSFRRAYGHLFNYCFCKSTLSTSFPGRRRRDYTAGAGNVRVHIMHQAVNTRSQQRAASATQETQEL